LLGIELLHVWRSDEKEALDLLHNPHFVSIGTTQMNTRINRMDWASVESPTERNIHPPILSTARETDALAARGTPTVSPHYDRTCLRTSSDCTPKAPTAER
jgi:hypothetical protein